MAIGNLLLPAKIHSFFFHHHWKEVERRTKENLTLDDIMLSQMIDEKKRWKEILKRIIDVILLLCKQNLAFRGHREHFGCLGRHESQEDENMGNFLEIMKLLAKYDSVLEKHLQNVSENPGSVHYMSKTVQNELIHLMAEEVKDVIKGEIQCSKYFGMLFDTTPDLGREKRCLRSCGMCTLTTK